jgi:hypothetical protein
MNTTRAYVLTGALVGVPLMAFALFGQTQGSLFAREASAGYGQEKVTICHKERQTLEVAEPGVAAHVAHGDTLGACEPRPAREARPAPR